MHYEETVGENYLSVAKLFPIHIFISTPVLWPAGQQAVNS